MERGISPSGHRVSLIIAIFILSAEQGIISLYAAFHINKWRPRILIPSSCGEVEDFDGIIKKDPSI